MYYRVYPDATSPYYFRLYVHKNLKSLRRAWDEIDAEKPHSSRSIKAFFIAAPVDKNYIGEIHITRKTEIDIIAHECLHALLHLSRLKNLNIYHTEENFCYTFQVIFDSVLKQVSSKT